MYGLGFTSIILSLVMGVQVFAQQSSSPIYEFIDEHPPAARMYTLCSQTPFRSLDGGRNGLILTNDPQGSIKVKLEHVPDTLIFANRHFVLYLKDKQSYIHDIKSQASRPFAKRDSSLNSKCEGGDQLLMLGEQAYYLNKHISEVLPVVMTPEEMDLVYLHQGFAIFEEYNSEGKSKALHLESGKIIWVADPYSTLDVRDVVQIEGEKVSYIYDRSKKSWSNLDSSGFDQVIDYNSDRGDLKVVTLFKGDKRVENVRSVLMQEWLRIQNEGGEINRAFKPRHQTLNLKTKVWTNNELAPGYLSISTNEYGFIEATDYLLQRDLFLPGTNLESLTDQTTRDKQRIAQLASSNWPESFGEGRWLLIKTSDSTPSRIINTSSKRVWEFNGGSIYSSSVITSSSNEILAFESEEGVHVIRRESPHIQNIGPGILRSFVGDTLYLMTKNFKEVSIQFTSRTSTKHFEFASASDIAGSALGPNACRQDMSHYLKSFGLPEEASTKQLAMALVRKFSNKKMNDANDLRILQHLFLLDANAARSIISNFDLSRSLALSATRKMQELCPEVKEALSYRFKDLVKEIESNKSNGHHHRSLLELVHLPLFADVFSDMDKKEQYHSVELLSESLRDAAVHTEPFKRVFASKLYYFAKNHIEFLLGLEVEPMSDLTAIAVGKAKVKPIILKSCSHENSPREFIFGICYELPRPIDSKKWQKGEVYKSDYEWNVFGERWTGRLNIENKGSLGDLVPKTKSFDYASIKEDGQWVGLIAISTNTGEPLAERIRKSYVRHLSRIGFVVDPALTVYNLAGYMKNRIENGEIDFLIKEAHSDGDDQNIARFGRMAKVYVARKQGADGVSHKVYIVEPFEAKYSKVESELISNNDFGEWIRARKNNGKQPLIYFNLSCSSFTKAMNEITAAASSHLVPIPTLGARYFFVDGKKDSLKHLLNSFYKEESFQQMRERLSSYETKYAEGDDQYLFPDSDKYDEYVRQDLDNALDIQSQIWNSRAELIEVDEQFH